MARNEEKQLARLNRFYLQQQKEEEIKKRPPRPRLDSLHTVDEIKVWLPSIMRDIDFYVQQMEVPCFPARQIEQFEQRIDHLRGEYKAFIRKIRKLDPEIDASPWSQRPYSGKRRKILTTEMPASGKTGATTNYTTTVVLGDNSKRFSPISTPVLSKDNFYQHCYGYGKPKEPLILRSNDMLQDKPLELSFEDCTAKKAPEIYTEAFFSDFDNSIEYVRNQPLKFVKGETLNSSRHGDYTDYNYEDPQGKHGGFESSKSNCTSENGRSHHHSTLKPDSSLQNDSPISHTAAKNIDIQVKEGLCCGKCVDDGAKDKNCEINILPHDDNSVKSSDIQIKGSLNIPYTDSSSSEDET